MLFYGNISQMKKPELISRTEGQTVSARCFTQDREREEERENKGM